MRVEGKDAFSWSPLHYIVIIKEGKRLSLPAILYSVGDGFESVSCSEWGERRKERSFDMSSHNTSIKPYFIGYYAYCYTFSFLSHSTKSSVMKVYR